MLVDLFSVMETWNTNMPHIPIPAPSNGDGEILDFESCVYIQAQCRARRGYLSNRFYKLPNVLVSSSRAQILKPVFDGPHIGLSRGASVASGSTIFYMGGVQDIEVASKSDGYPQLKSNKFYYKDVATNSSWKQGPSMISCRAGHHAAFVDGKIYVFGSTWLLSESPDLGEDQWAEVLDISQESPSITRLKWEQVPPFVVIQSDDVAFGHACVDYHKDTILLFCERLRFIMLYNTITQVWNFKHLSAKFHIVTSMDEIIYAAGYDDEGFETVYAFQVTSYKEVHTPVQGLKITPGRLLPSGIIPLGNNTLCVLTTTGCQPNDEDTNFYFCCSTYVISKAKDAYAMLCVTARPVSKSVYVLGGAISVDSCLSMHITKEETITAESASSSGERRVDTIHYRPRSVNPVRARDIKGRSNQA